MIEIIGISNGNIANLVVLSVGLVVFLAMVYTFHRIHKEFLNRKARYIEILKCIRRGEFANADGSAKIDALLNRLAGFSMRDREAATNAAELYSTTSKKLQVSSDLPTGLVIEPERQGLPRTEPELIESAHLFGDQTETAAAGPRRLLPLSVGD